ncbi:anti-sigma factor [Anaeromyxobacter paludicola]|uniref:Transmembrane anti-sigma factor n=1 Tax=Anaeromyxobacter paludicola TaxID=2918171 RepID=A0ABN6NC34_9BACT|nr:hypothetical protein [Anaeromyxobacter paludicola]BDG09508.1 hypothetical protein AMPC_26210 [Anaeromyxobacter paludicola]
MNGHAGRDSLRDLSRGRLPPALEAEVRTHLAGCEGCAAAVENERALDDALARRPRRPAPAELRARLAAMAAGAGPPRPRAPAARRWATRLAAPVAAALAAGLLVFAGLRTHQDRRGLDEARARLRVEAVNDHLRVLKSERPLEVQAGGAHQVKPWFEGRVDFAPDVPDAPGLVLRGGAVGWFHDRDAAVIAYTLRLHKVTLLEFRCAGLPWPAADAPKQQPPHRGYNVFAWKKGELGYALVSDASAADLGAVAKAIAGTL